MSFLRNLRPSTLLYLALFIALTGFVGSLFFSEVDGFIPCFLCWYQRICLYPLVPILAIGLLRRDKQVHYYVLPLSVIGFFIAFYHNVIYYIERYNLGTLSTNCTANGGASCTARYIEWMGFITIPLLSLLAFLAITILMVWYHYSLKAQD
ncbi:MAG: disulfide oxidoreductase [bacterium]